MLKNITKILTIFLLTQLVTSCAFNTLDMYKGQISELNRDPKTRIMKGDENDLNNLEGCPVLFGMGSWENDGRSQSWYEQNGMVHEIGVSLDRDYRLSNKVLGNTDNYPVYIGSWRLILKLNKQIRFFAYQKKEGGKLYYQYESMTEENKNIQEKPFSLHSHPLHGIFANNESIHLASRASK